ncbi:MAG: hypothetical protein KF729_18180 [Sandaracinaceae bacterium]|nr:hypothetical protein [Sandaracinaceae bacterium]
MPETLSSPDALDPELLELPAPPRARRLVALGAMALAFVASSAFAVSLRHDLAYFFHRGAALDLGDAATLDRAALATNVEARVAGTPMLSRAVRYRRVLTGAEHVVFPLAGQRTIYVHADASPSSLARTEFTGRLVTFADLGARVDDVEVYLARDMNLPVSGESYLLLADEPPSGSWWALLLALLCLAFVGLDAWLLLRWFRPAPYRG